jgi:hypothetical protein
VDLQTAVLGGGFCGAYCRGEIQTFRAPDCQCGALNSGGGSMDASDWINAGMAGNQAAMQWYVLAHPDSQLPTPPSVVNVPGGQVSFNANLIVLGLGAVVLFILLAK